MKSSAKKVELASVDDLFSTEESRADAQREKVLEIPLWELHPFKDHPFKVKDDEAMMETADSIRQYLTREKLWEVATSPEALLKLCSDLLAEREKNAALQADNARLQGKAVYYDLFIDLRHSTNLRTTAKELDVPERRFVRFLLERRYVYRTPSGCVLPYAKSANVGLFCVKDFCRNGHTGSYTLVTPKGKLHFAELRSLILVTVTIRG